MTNNSNNNTEGRKNDFAKARWDLLPDRVRRNALRLGYEEIHEAAPFSSGAPKKLWLAALASATAYGEGHLERAHTLVTETLEMLAMVYEHERSVRDRSVRARERARLRAANEVALVLAWGADQYGDENWRRVPRARKRYLAAYWRHLYAFAVGDPADPETGLHALAHAACNAIFLEAFGTDAQAQAQAQAQAPAASVTVDGEPLAVACQ